MKKSLLIILLAGLFAVPAFAQYVKIWEKSQAGGNFPTWMGTAHTERGFAFGTVGGNDRVYVVSRKTGTNVVIVNANTGDSVGVLNTTGVTGGTFALNDVEVSSDGVIFGANLTINSGADTLFKVYKWTNETAVPVLVFSAKLNARLGDKFTVVGSTLDNSVQVWAHNPAGKIVKLTTTDGGNTFTAAEITLSTGASGSSPAVYPLPEGGFITNSNGRNIVFYNDAGTALDTISGALVATGSNALRAWADGSKKYIVVYNYGGGNENLRVVDYSDGVDNAKLTAVTNSLGAIANPNGVGDVGFKNNGDNTFNLYILGTNNGLGAYRYNYLTIAQAREDLNTDNVPDRLNDTVTVRGVVYTPDYQGSNHSYVIWDGTAGITEFMYGDSAAVLNYGDYVQITGKIGQYRGLTQLQPFTTASIVVLSDSNFSMLPTPIVLSIGQYKSNPEAYESSLIGFINVSKVSGTWPAANSSATLKISDGVDTVDYRISNTTDIDGQPEPTWPRDLVGVASQFSSGTTVTTGGLQLQPRYYAMDILPPFTIPVELTSFSAKTVNGNVMLTWETATETNNSGFAVERSSDNKSFAKIGFVSGSGTSTEKHNYSFVDKNISGTVYYRLKQIDYDGSYSYSSTVKVNVEVPAEFNLAQNYPNPFNPATTINFTLPVNAQVKVTIYNILGKEITTLVNKELAAGSHNFNLNLSSVSSGVYFYTIEAKGADGSIFTNTKKMTLLK